MKLLQHGPDGGAGSPVTGYWWIEIKQLFSIVLLRFAPGGRDVYHSHAFAALTWFLWGRAVELFPGSAERVWLPSLRPKYTPRTCVHKVKTTTTTWALSFRGPWRRHWHEVNDQGEVTTLAWNRRVVGVE